MLPKLNQKAQTTAEYAILIAIVVGAVVAMQVYIKRGLEGRVKNAVDYVPGGLTGVTVGDKNLKFTNEQYEPYYAASESDSAREAKNREVLGTGGEVGRGAYEQTVQLRKQTTGWGVADKAGTISGKAAAVKKSGDLEIPAVNTNPAP